ncbi:germ cell-specific gene 1-like protein [Ptychodera flava]|uniref:germ cell-specific gene 1-like protein n=1 Tax=Ptychodera flava TaxID=63121 RepID=UPI003969CE50
MATKTMPEQSDEEKKKEDSKRSGSGAFLKCLLCLPIIGVVLPILGTVFAGVAIGTSYWIVGSMTVYDFPNRTDDDTDSTKQITFLSHTGLFQHCELREDFVETEKDSTWLCINVIEMMGAKELEGDILTEQLKSVIAFEIISFVASCSAGLSAIVGWLTGHPLAMLVSGVVGAMAGLFMMVGNSMYMIVHNEVQEKSKQLKMAYEEWGFGWSLNLGWCAFVMCALATFVQFVVYTAFQKYRKEHPDANMSSLCQFFDRFECSVLFKRNNENASSKNLPDSTSKDDLKTPSSPRSDA